MRRSAVLSFALLLAVACASLTPSASGAPGKVSVVGGTPIAIESVPWQVYLQVGTVVACGGSVLDARRVLTAAHCVTPAGSTAPHPIADMVILAGFNDIKTYVPGQPPPAGSQAVGVSGVRIHPLWQGAVDKGDDVAVLTLATPLNLSGPRTKAIALAPVGGGPASGSALGFSGYGMQIEGVPPEGRLYGGTLTAVGDDQCRPNLNPDASASVQCVAAGRPASCFGDSGGPLTSGGLQIGVSSFAPGNGCANGPAGFADVTVPEVRAFIDGAATVPVAPRLTSAPGLYAVNPPVQGSPFTCTPGTWSNPLAISYTFLDETSGAALQGGASPRFVPTAAHRGMAIVCVVQASNDGGTSTSRSGVSSPVRADLVAPRAALLSARCRHRRCKVRLGAADSNSQGALRIRVTSERRVRGRCGRGSRRRPCTKTRVKKFAVEHARGTIYRATASRVRRGTSRLRIRVIDAAGNRRRPDITRKLRVR